jgi:hypothetical protein
VVQVKTKHKYTVENDIIIYHDRERLSADMKKFKEAWITVSDEKPTRSNQQLRYYRGVIVKMISDETGYTADEVHIMLLINAFGSHEAEMLGNKYQIPNKTTSELNTAEEEEYHTVCREFASIKINLYIPLPNEVEVE